MTLIERLEQAAEGSAELDREVAIEIGGYPIVLGLPQANQSPTRSLDGAREVVPRGVWWSVSGHDAERHVYTASVEHGAAPDRRCFAQAMTPALAVCAAALKARRQLSNQPAEPAPAE